jgi:hypothetical protein
MYTKVGVKEYEMAGKKPPSAASSLLNRATSCVAEPLRW